MTDKLTILRCAKPRVLTKTHTADGTSSYDRPKWFRVEPADVDSIHGLHALLDDIAEDRQACIIRGVFRGEYAVADMTYHDEPVWQPSTETVRRVAMAFIDAPARWLSLDIDGWTGSTVDPLTDPEGAIEQWIAQHLPRAFHGITCVWQLSASAGIKPGLRAHLWFWLTAPASGGQLKAWAKSLSAGSRAEVVDPSFFENVRVHYTADPVFRGIEDPVPGPRLGLCVGLQGDAVDLDLTDVPAPAAIEDEDDADDEVGPDGVTELSEAELVNFRTPTPMADEEVRYYLRALPPEEWKPYHPWLRNGMALHNQYEGAPAGLDMWDELCRELTPEDYDHAELVAKWESFSKKRDGPPVTMASIIKLVKDNGYDFNYSLREIDNAPSYRKALDVVARASLSETELDTVMPKLVQKAKDGGIEARQASVRKEIRDRKKEMAEAESNDAGGYIERSLVDAFLRAYRKGGKDRLLCLGNTFWLYDHGVWREVEKNAIKHELLGFFDALQKSNRSEYQRLFQALKKSGRDIAINALSNALVDLIAAVTTDPRDPDPLRINSPNPGSVFNCRNGEVWIADDGEADFIAHDPDHRLETQLGCDYDPEAECPEYDRSLARIFRDNDDTDDMVRHYFELMGYMLQTSREFPAWVLFQGGGSNGKSYVTSIIQAVMGPQGWVAGSLSTFDEERGKHVGWGLVGKKLMIDDDYSKNKVVNDSQLKKYSEEKPMTAEPKFGRPFNFQCRALPLILSNSWPRTRDLSYGLVRRAQVFRFNTQLTEDEIDIGLKGRVIANELPGVLNKCIAGMQRLRRRGHFLKPKSCRDAEALWLRNRHGLGTFISECLDITGDQSDRAKATDVYDAFLLWSNHEGVDLRYGRNSFYEEILQAQGIHRTVRHNAIMFTGVRLVQRGGGAGQDLDFDESEDSDDFASGADDLDGFDIELPF